MYYSTLTQRVLAALEVDNLKEWLSCHTEELVGDRGSRIGCPLATYLRDSGFAMPWVNHSDLQVSDPDRLLAPEVIPLPPVLHLFIRLIDLSEMEEISGARALQCLEQAVVNTARHAEGVRQSLGTFIPRVVAAKAAMINPVPDFTAPETIEEKEPEVQYEYSTG